MLRRFRLLQNFTAVGYIEFVLICAISTIFIIRLYLYITGYPQVGTGTLHIAHVLYSGFLLLGAVCFMLTYFNSYVTKLACLCAGVGFGLFIDELGKFITKSNDYFYEPTIAVVYIIFICIFLLLHFGLRMQKKADQDYILNAWEQIQQLLVNPHNWQAAMRARRYLQMVTDQNPLVTQFQSVLASFDIVQPTGSVSQSFLQQFDLSIKNLLRWRWFVPIFSSLFCFYTLYNIYQVWSVVHLYFVLEDFTLSPIDIGQFATTLISSLLIIIGFSQFKYNKHRAYKLFRYALLISLFLTQFFAFYRDQLIAAVGLIINLGFLSIIALLLQTE